MRLDTSSDMKFETFHDICGPWINYCFPVKAYGSSVLYVYKAASASSVDSTSLSKLEWEQESHNYLLSHAIANNTTTTLGKISLWKRTDRIWTLATLRKSPALPVNHLASSSLRKSLFVFFLVLSLLTNLFQMIKALTWGQL